MHKHTLFRIIVIWVIQTVGLIFLSGFISGVHVNAVVTAIVAAGVIGLLNSFLWPFFTRILVPFAVFTLGFAALALNALLVGLAAKLVPGFTIDSFWAAFWLSLGLTAVTIAFSTIFSLGEDNSWSKRMVRKRMRKTTKPIKTDVPGVIFLEIDGLAKPILEQAMQEGNAPVLKSWLERGSHILTGWTPDTSSQTSASQAGILHGNNTNIPAFRWYDKKLQQIVASSNSKLLPQIEKERSDGKGLLSENGASRGNLFSGDADDVMATASAIRDRSKFHTTDFEAFFANPYNTSRTLLLFVWDIFLEWRQFRFARKHKVTPILDKKHRGFPYPLIRAAMTVLMRELNINTVLGDIFAGIPAVYTTFVGYDEVAHHSGIYDPGAFDVLRKLDQQFGRIEAALSDAPRPYYLVVLSDHGQTGGATFLQRYGYSLDQYVQTLIAQGEKVHTDLSEGDTGLGSLNSLLTDTIHNESSISAKLLGKALKQNPATGEVDITSTQKTKKAAKSDEKDTAATADMVVLASGNLGIISCTKIPHRATLEELQQQYPDVLPGLLQHPGIGFVMVRSAKKGAVVMSSRGVRYLKTNVIIGEDPLAVFGHHAADQLRRTDSFDNCPDIVVNSFYDPAKNEGCAFEELIGFHGGLGGTQTEPFILHPKEMKITSDLVGAAAVYQASKRWLVALQSPTTSQARQSSKKLS